MNPYNKNDSRFKIGQHIRMVICRNPLIEQDIEPRVQIIKVSENRVEVRNKYNEVLLLIKNGGGFFFTDFNGDILRRR